MANVGGVTGAGNGQVPGFQEGGMSQDAIDKMSNDQLVNLAQTGSEVDRKNAAAELKERLGGEKVEKGEKGEKGGGAEGAGGAGGGGGEIDDELQKIIDKLLRGEKLTPEEEMKLKGALGPTNDLGGDGNIGGDQPETEPKV